jgi:hypothetical protein
MPLTDPKPRKPGSQLLLTLKGKSVAIACEIEAPVWTDSAARSQRQVVGWHDRGRKAVPRLQQINEGLDKVTEPGRPCGGT